MSMRISLAVRAAVLYFFAHLKKRVLLYVISSVFMLLALLFSIWAYTEVLWFQAIGYANVIFTMVEVQFWMGLLPFAAMSLMVIVSMNLARQLAPVDRIISSDERKIDKWRRALAPLARPIITAIGLLCGLILALNTFIHWDTWLLFNNGPEWGRTDPQFGRDLQYFMFRLPFYTLVNKWMFIGLLVTLILTALTSYLFGGLRPQAPGAKIPIQVNLHLSAFLIALMAILGWGLILELHLLSYSERGVITGLGFTDANASLVAYQFVATAVVTGFVLFQLNIRKPGWILPTLALIWLFLVGLAAARFYPALYQLIIVEPQELEREHPHIQSHLEFTRYGFALDDVEHRVTAGDEGLTEAELTRYRDVVSQLRLWDPDTLLINMQELQALRTYFDFQDVDVDRYEIDGRTELVMIAAREVNERRIPEGSRRWQAERMIYTHGYGVVAAAPSEFTKAGMPVFKVKDMPLVGPQALMPDNPRIYYGENSPPYSLVSSETIELDRPIDPSRDEDAERSDDEGEVREPLPLMDSLSGIAARLGTGEGDARSGAPDTRATDGSVQDGDGTDTADEPPARLTSGTQPSDANEAETKPDEADQAEVRADPSDANRGRSGDDASNARSDGPTRADGERPQRRDCPARGVDGSQGGEDSGEADGTNVGAEEPACTAAGVGFQFHNYQGVGGVPVENLLHRLAFAVRFWDLRLALTWLLGNETRVMFHRNVRDRVERVVPYLMVDRNPYPVAVDGRVKWIVDVYTVSDMMPYSRRVNLSDLTQSDQPKQDGSTLIPEEFVRSQAGRSGTANYIRNSVKAVVDAYDGTVTLYVVDETDKVLQAWRNVFEDKYVAIEDASAALRRHFRYPHDMFKIQSVVWSDFHMRTAEAFYTREAAWRIPPDASFISLRRERQEGEHEARRADLRPYWLLTQFPEEDGPQFAIVQPFSPDQRNVLTGYLAGLSDGERYGKLVAYAFSPTTTVLGPAQAQARIDQDARISAWMTLRMQSGSRVSRGRLLALPVADGLIYVQPLFVQADKSEVSQLLGAQLSSIPELKKVVALFGDTVVMRDTLEDAVTAVFGLDGGADAPARDDLGMGADAGQRGDRAAQDPAPRADLSPRPPPEEATKQARAAGPSQPIAQ